LWRSKLSKMLRSPVRRVVVLFIKLGFFWRMQIHCALAYNVRCLGLLGCNNLRLALGGASPTISAEVPNPFHEGCSSETDAFISTVATVLKKKTDRMLSLTVCCTPACKPPVSPPGQVPWCTESQYPSELQPYVSDLWPHIPR